MPAERAESVSTFDALGRVLAEDVRSLLDVPPADNSEMDGYALRVADVAEPGTVLRVSQRIAAGKVGTALEPGTAARIFTGAQVPAGADAVVMQELCTPVEGGVRIDASPKREGSRSGVAARTCSHDATVLRAGLRLGAAGARHGRLGRRGERSGWARGRASRCSPPATSWRCRATRSSPGRSTTRTASPCAA